MTSSNYMAMRAQQIALMARSFHWASDTKESYFQHIHKDPETMKDFNTFMCGNRSTRQHWIDWVPVEGLKSYLEGMKVKTRSCSLMLEAVKDMP